MDFQVLDPVAPKTAQDNWLNFIGKIGKTHRSWLLEIPND